MAHPETIKLPELIAPYGGMISWDEQRLSMGDRLLELKVRLTPSEECPSTGEREIRTDLYIQAELLISHLEDEGLMCFQSPRIIIDWEGGVLTGMVELRIRIS
jgi:hypothetical protein